MLAQYPISGAAIGGNPTAQSSSGSGSFTRTVSVTLGDENGAATNLSGLDVSFHDEAKPSLTTTARYQSSTQTTNSSGLLTFQVQSYLAAGSKGLLSVLLPDGRHYLQPVSVT